MPNMLTPCYCMNSILWNVVILLPDYTASHSRRQHSCIYQRGPFSSQIGWNLVYIKTSIPSKVKALIFVGRERIKQEATYHYEQHLSHSAQSLRPSSTQPQPAQPVLKTICGITQTCSSDDGHNNARNKLRQTIDNKLQISCFLLVSLSTSR